MFTPTITKSPIHNKPHRIQKPPNQIKTIHQNQNANVAKPKIVDPVKSPDNQSHNPEPLHPPHTQKKASQVASPPNLPLPAAISFPAARIQGIQFPAFNNKKVFFALLTPPNPAKPPKEPCKSYTETLERLQP